MFHGGWRPYVPVAKRRANAAREMEKLRKQGMVIEPIDIQGTKIARTFWGAAWCKHLEQLSDYANRLPRGRTYVRNGSVCHLEVKKGRVEAVVSGSELYTVAIEIAPLPSARWKNVRAQCAGQIGSMLELLQGRLSSRVMEIVTDPINGLFPRPKDIKLHCSCPDWAGMCKHVAAVLYGIGARLDERPELLFLLRKVDHEELITTELDMASATARAGKRRRLAGQDLSNMFGIDIEETAPPAKKGNAPPRKATRRSTNAISASKSRAAERAKPTLGATPAAPAQETFTPTGTAVARLRKQLGMTRPQFAQWLGVSAQTVTNWESKRGRLNLQERTLAALTRAWSQR